jgi:hypothetical protein
MGDRFAPCFPSSLDGLYYIALQFPICFVLPAICRQYIQINYDIVVVRKQGDIRRRLPSDEEFALGLNFESHQ